MSESKPVRPEPDALSAAPSSPSLAAGTAVRDQPGLEPSTPNPLLAASLPYMGGAGLIALQQTTSWQGPYPSPDAVERFEAVLPGAFDRILTMAEKAQASQLKTAENAQVLLSLDVKRSHYLGAGISFLAIICSTLSGLMDHPAGAVALVGIPVMAVAQAFLGRRGRSGVDTASPSQQTPNEAPPATHQD